MNWQDKKRPGPNKKKHKRKTIYATVHSNTAKFLTDYRENQDVGEVGRLIDKLVSSKFPHVKIEEESC